MPRTGEEIITDHAWGEENMDAIRDGKRCLKDPYAAMG
jgi:hypothetical protein